MKRCQICNKTDEEYIIEELETLNCIFTLCLDCYSDIECMIEDKLKFYKNGEQC